MQTLEILNRFFSIRTGVFIADVKPGQVAVATCDRRTYAELGYGFIRLLWVLHFVDRVVISVHPVALAEISRLAFGRTPQDVMTDEFMTAADEIMQTALPGVSFELVGDSIIFYHPGNASDIQTDGLVRILTAADKDKWEGPEEYLRDMKHPSVEKGDAFGLFLDDTLIGAVTTHPTPVQEMGDIVTEEGIDVAEAFRCRGYGKAILSAWTREMQACGKACIHSTSLDNLASMALARSAGYVEYARARTIVYHPPDS